ncbi:MAG: aldehyde dehydrogenase family protein, partial [Erysipelotrichia bacterium]|nr:aldehyde dehydrogenase family protein [Erysipelotrichia bacterium]
MMDEKLITNTVQAQHDFFNRNRTRTIAFRKRMLKMLLKVMKSSENELFDALYQDLAKSKAEAYMTEVALAEEEIRTQLAHIDSWSRPEQVRPVLATFPSGGTVYREPYGVMLIVVPWNYPVNLSFTPLAGAIAAGNTVIMKCSRNNEHCWRVIQKMINETFPHDYIFCVDADSDYDAVIRQKYDYIFFTGSPKIGRTVMHAAADNLTPVTLELGGKSPCIIDKSANLKIAAKRIVWGKFLNAGQTCISIDYLLTEESIKPALIHELQIAIEERYSNAENSETYP